MEPTIIRGQAGTLNLEEVDFRTPVGEPDPIAAETDSLSGASSVAQSSFMPDEAWAHATMHFRAFHGIQVVLLNCSFGACLQIRNGGTFYNVRECGSVGTQWEYDAFQLGTIRGDLDSVLQQVEQDVRSRY